MPRNNFARLLLLLLAATCLSPAAEKYNGPRPPKADVIYLLHASNLIPTEIVQAREESKGKDTLATVAGATSTARTPLPEPIFLLKADRLSPERLALYKFETRNGRREVVISGRRSSKSGRPIPIIFNRLEEGLYRIEANQFLENGEYGLSPEGSDDVFCFQVY